MNIASATTWKPYPKYKDSGIEWLGKIPEGWEMKRLKNVVNLNPDTLPETTAPDFEMQYIDIGNVTSDGNISELQEFSFELAPSRARRIVRSKDTIISTVRTYLKAIAYFENPSDNLIVSTGFAVLRVKAGVEPRYFYYLSKCEQVIQQIMANSVGVSYPAISPSVLGCLPVWLPSLPEQQAIASFLDHETAKIDVLIAKKEKLIKLLEEKRAALISHAVTKGLDPNAPMKDSGIEWIGEIPGHWNIEPLGVNSRLIVPMRDKPPAFDGEIPWIRIEDFDGKYIFDSKSDQRVSDDIVKVMHLKIYPIGTVLCSCSCDMGATAIVAKPLISNQTFIGIIPSSRLDSEYLYYLMQVAKVHLNVISTGAIQQYLSKNDFSRLRIPFPGVKEQRAIADYLDRETSKIDTLISRISEHIARLHEYRTALISAAVTGKIDVREA